MTTFGGQQIKRPGAYSTVDANGMTPSSLGAFNVLAFVGQMDASARLESHKAFYFNSPSEARKALKKGALLDNLNTAWAHGADLIAVVRAEPSTQATASIKDGATTPVEVIKLTSKPYGTDGNEFTYHIASGEIVVVGDDVTEKYVLGTKSNTDIVAEINKNSKLVTATEVGTTKPANPTTATKMVGGTGGGAPTDAQWQTAIDALAPEFVDGIVPVSTASAIHAKVDAHAVSMSNTTNRKERRAFYGHASGLTATDVAGLTASLKSKRATYASPAVYVFGAENEKVLKDSVLLASAYAGLWASKNPQDPITYDYVNFAGVDKIYTPTEINDLLTAGVSPAEVVRGRGIRIVQGITTTSSTNLADRELSVTTLIDKMSANLRDTLEEKHVGTAGVAGIEVTIYNDVISIIEFFQKNGWISSYVEDSVKVIKNGTSFTVEWEGKPTLPINNFFITSHFTL